MQMCSFYVHVDPFNAYGLTIFSCSQLSSIQIRLISFFSSSLSTKTISCFNTSVTDSVFAERFELIRCAAFALLFVQCSARWYSRNQSQLEKRLIFEQGISFSSVLHGDCTQRLFGIHCFH